MATCSIFANIQVKSMISHPVAFAVGCLVLQNTFTNSCRIKLVWRYNALTRENKSVEQAVLLERTNPIILIKTPFA